MSGNSGRQAEAGGRLALFSVVSADQI